MAQLRSELLLKEGTFVQQKQDYEDLLVLLEDQDGKIKKLKVGIFHQVNTQLSVLIDDEIR